MYLLAYLHKRAHQIPNQVIEKAAAAYRVNQLVTFPAPAGRMDSANIRRRLVFSPALRIDGGKRGEIVFAADERRGCTHCVFIQRKRMVVHMTREKWRADRCTQNAIAIGF